METKNKLYISDLDGTLLNSSAQLSEYTKKSLNKLINNGLNFSIATARLLTPVRKMLDGVNVNIPIVLMNGVLIYDLQKQGFVKVNKLANDIVDVVIEKIEEYDVFSFMYELKNNEVITFHETSKYYLSNSYLEERIKRYNSTHPEAGLRSIKSDSIIYFTLIDSKERLEPIYYALSKRDDLNQAFYKNVYNPDFWFLEIYGIESSKQMAVNYLREKYAFDQVIAFGDNHNDIPMFEASDICVAVENATLDIKEMADYICRANSEDGVVKWILENNSI